MKANTQLLLKNHMTDEDFIKIVVSKGKERLGKGESPNVSIIVKDDSIIAEGYSSVGNFEPSGHNDLNCINNAAKKLQVYDLEPKRKAGR